MTRSVLERFYADVVLSLETIQQLEAKTLSSDVETFEQSHRLGRLSTVGSVCSPFFPTDCIPDDEPTKLA